MPRQEGSSDGRRVTRAGAPGFAKASVTRVERSRGAADNRRLRRCDRDNTSVASLLDRIDVTERSGDGAEVVGAADGVLGDVYAPRRHHDRERGAAEHGGGPERIV